MKKNGSHLARHQDLAVGTRKIRAAELREKGVRGESPNRKNTAARGRGEGRSGKDGCWEERWGFRKWVSCACGGRETDKTSVRSEGEGG